MHRIPQPYSQKEQFSRKQKLF